MRFKIKTQVYQFNFRLSYSLMCLFLFTLCCCLGIWQLHRYAYKQNLLIKQQESISSPSRSFLHLLMADPSGSNVLEFQKVFLDGYYNSEQSILIQNKIHLGEVGFEVLTPFKVQGSDKLLLVDRGWVTQKNAADLALKNVPYQQHIQGYIKHNNEYQFTLGKNILTPSATPLIAQKIDLTEFSQILHQAFFPYILRLDPSQVNGFVRDWVVTSVMPQRHMGYAVQWFLLCVVLVVGYLCFSISKVENIHE